jgi:hypothetical protein
MSMPITVADRLTPKDSETMPINSGSSDATNVST